MTVSGNKENRLDTGQMKIVLLVRDVLGTDVLFNPNSHDQSTLCLLRMFFTLLYPSKNGCIRFFFSRNTECPDCPFPLSRPCPYQFFVHRSPLFLFLFLSFSLPRQSVVSEITPGPLIGFVQKNNNDNKIKQKKPPPPQRWPTQNSSSNSRCLSTTLILHQCRCIYTLDTLLTLVTPFSLFNIYLVSIVKVSFH